MGSIQRASPLVILKRLLQIVSKWLGIPILAIVRFLQRLWRGQKDFHSNVQGCADDTHRTNESVHYSASSIPTTIITPLHIDLPTHDSVISLSTNHPLVPISPPAFGAGTHSGHNHARDGEIMDDRDQISGSEDGGYPVTNHGHGSSTSSCSDRTLNERLEGPSSDSDVAGMGYLQAEGDAVITVEVQREGALACDLANSPVEASEPPCEGDVKDEVSERIYPIVPDGILRYERKDSVFLKADPPSYTLKPRQMDFDDSPIPEGWDKIIQPEGSPFFWHEQNRVVTESDICDKVIFKHLVGFIEDIKEYFRTRNLEQTAEVDLVLQVVHEPSLDQWWGGYYFVNHSERKLFWLEDYIISNLVNGVKGKLQHSHIGLYLEYQYWHHWALFPNVCPITPKVTALAEGAIRDAITDVVTSDFSTVNISLEQLKEGLALIKDTKDALKDLPSTAYTKECASIIEEIVKDYRPSKEVTILVTKISELLEIHKSSAKDTTDLAGDINNILNDHQSSVDYVKETADLVKDVKSALEGSRFSSPRYSLSAASVWCIGRFMKPIVLGRFLNFYGQRVCRLDPRNSVHGNPAKSASDTTILFRFLSPALFCAPDVHFRTLEQLWVDKLTIAEFWKHLFSQLHNEWRDQLFYASLLLTSNIAFLTLPNVTAEDPDFIQGTVIQIPSYLSTISSVASIILGLLLSRQHQIRVNANVSAGEIHSFIQKRYHPNSGFERLAIMYSLPYALLMWGIASFFFAFMTMCFFKTTIVARSISGAYCFAVACLLIWYIHMSWDKNTNRWSSLYISFWEKIKKEGNVLIDSQHHAAAESTLDAESNDKTDEDESEFTISTTPGSISDASSTASSKKNVTLWRKILTARRNKSKQKSTHRDSV